MRVTIAALVAVSVALLCASCGGTGPTLVSAHSVTITGRILDATTGQPVAGAVVSVGDQSAITDADGYYRLTNVPAGTTHITVTPPDGWSLAGGVASVEIELGRNQIDAIYLVPDLERPPSPPGNSS